MRDTPMGHARYCPPVVHHARGAGPSMVDARGLDAFLGAFGTFTTEASVS